MNVKNIQMVGIKIAECVILLMKGTKNVTEEGNLVN